MKTEFGGTIGLTQTEVAESVFLRRISAIAAASAQPLTCAVMFRLLWQVVRAQDWEFGGCIWTYESLPHDIMPEVFFLARCRMDVG